MQVATLRTGTASADDLSLANGSVVLPAGARSASIPIAITDDSLNEDAENFTIVLGAPSNGIQLGRSQATGTILDNDGPPSVDVVPTSASEGDTSLTDVPVTVALSSPSGKPVTVAYTTADGTATSPDDYYASAGSITIEPGQLQGIIHVSLKGDSIAEPDKSFHVDLSSPQNATLGTSTADVTIRDDDPLVVEVTSPAVTEGTGGVTPADFSVALVPVPPSDTTVSIDYHVEGLTATVPEDLAAQSGTLTFLPGEGAKTVTASVVADTVPEQTEFFRLTIDRISASGHRSVLLGDTSTASILDDDTSAKVDQTITFAPIDDHTYLDQDFDVSAVASSGLPVAFTVDTADQCTLSGATVHLLAPGKCSVTAHQGGDSNYNPAPDVSRTFSIAKADQSITFGTTDPKTFGDPDFTVVATTNAGLSVSLTVTSGPCSLDSAISPATVHLAGAGSCAVTASQGGDSNFNAAPDVIRTFDVAKANQTIAFPALQNETWGDPQFPVAGTATSGLPVTFTVGATDQCSIATGTVSISGAGSCTVTAHQNGDLNYNPAPDVSQTFSIAKASQTVMFGVVGNRSYGDPAFSLNASASSGLVVTFSASGNCIVAAATVQITGAGSCIVTASQSGDSNFNAAVDVTRSFDISKAQTVTAATVEPLASNPTTQFSDTVVLKATVSVEPTATGNGTFDGSVSFAFNGVSAGPPVAVSDRSPATQELVRLDSISIPAGAGSYVVSATFTPAVGGNYAGSASPTGQLAGIRQEGARADGTDDGSTKLDYSGDQYVVVGGAPSLAVTLSQSLPPEGDDAEYVDYSKSDVYVVFKIYPVACGTSCPTVPLYTSPNVRVVDRSDWASTGMGFAGIAGPKSLAEGSYLVAASLIANGYIVAEVASATVDIASATGGFITGGGFVTRDSTSNVANPKGNFGFNVKLGKNSLQGSSTYVYRVRMDIVASTSANIALCTTLSSSCRDVDILVRSNKLASLNIGTATSFPMTAFATGQFAVQFVDASDGSTHYTQFEFGGGTFRIDITDTMPGGQTDTYGFTAYRKDGTVFHQAYVPVSSPRPQNGTGSVTNQAVVGGGNVTVHVK